MVEAESLSAGRGHGQQSRRPFPPRGDVPCADLFARPGARYLRRMPPTAPARPAPDEYNAFYAAYIALVPDGDVRALLETQGAETAAFIRSRGDAWAASRYAPGKWSPKEVICHMADAERIFAYRALRIARGDQTPLASFDENAYVPLSGADARSVSDLLDEMAAVRTATVRLFRTFDDAAWKRSGTASGKPISVRALAYITAGHERHHLAILKERYR